MNSKHWRIHSRVLLAIMLGLASCFSAVDAEAQIRNPGAHPRASAEIEPHLVVDFGGDDDFGLGIRGTFIVMDPGFVPTINNTVGIGVGLDLILDDDDHCHDDFCHDRDRVHLPVVLQWNFWFSRHWSVFVEPGLVFKIQDHDHRDRDDDIDLDLALYIGGRYNFNDTVAITLRLGTPTDLSLGASFFF